MFIEFVAVCTTTGKTKYIQAMCMRPAAFETVVESLMSVCVNYRKVKCACTYLLITLNSVQSPINHLSNTSTAGFQLLLSDNCDNYELGINFPLLEVM